jgi:transcriptional regulator with XRE-family HTH domain
MMTSDQLRAARILLHLDQRELAAKALVGVATVRRFEGGEEVGALQREAMRRAVEEAGAILLASGQDLGGRAIEAGVALVRREDLPRETRERLSSGDWGRRKRPAKAGEPADAPEAGMAGPDERGPEAPDAV